MRVEQQAIIEEPAIKIADSEVPLVAFHDIGVWAFIILCAGLVWLWIRSKK